MGIEQHLDALIGNSAPLRRLVPYDPLSAAEMLALVGDEGMESLSEESLKRLWITPISRLLQNHFGIDQRRYNASTSPTISELEEDFKVAVAITTQKFFLNQHELAGIEQAAGSTRIWTSILPSRVHAIMARYRVGGGKVMRG